MTSDRRPLSRKIQRIGFLNILLVMWMFCARVARYSGIGDGKLLNSTLSLNFMTSFSRSVSISLCMSADGCLLDRVSNFIWITDCNEQELGRLL